MNKTFKYVLIALGLFVFVELQVVMFISIDSYIKINNMRLNGSEQKQFEKNFSKGNMDKFMNKPDNIDDDISNDITIPDSNNKSKQNKTK